MGCRITRAILADRTPRRAAIGEGISNMKSIIIVGSGVAGALLARQLLKTNDCQITMFEAGPDFETSYRKWLDYLMTGSNPYQKFWDEPALRMDGSGFVGHGFL